MRRGSRRRRTTSTSCWPRTWRGRADPGRFHPSAGFKFETYEQSLTKKAEIVKALKDSFAHVRGALAKASDADLDKAAEYFGLKTTGRGTYLLILSHAHEHLGQAIAYARSNDVTPPWSMRRQAPPE